MNIGIIWANPNSANLGVSALAWSAAHIVKLAFEKSSDIKIHFFCCDDIGEVSLDFPEESIRVSKHGYFRYKGLVSKFKMMNLRNKVPSLLRQMDIILDVGEGDSFSDIYGLERLDNLLHTKEFVKNQGKKQIMLPQTIGPFETQNQIVRVSAAMNSMQLILARDAISYAVLNRISPTTRSLESIDMAFALPWKPLSSNNNGVIRVGLNVSGLLWNNGYTGNNEFNLNINYKEAIVKLIEHILTKENTVIALIPHVFGEKCMKVEDDVAASLEITSIFNDDRVFIQTGYCDPCSAKSYIAMCDLFLGARMHACIAAYSAGVPVIPMAYSRKFNGLFQDTLGYEYLIDMKNTSIPEIVDSFDKIYKNRGIAERNILLSMDEKIKPRINQLIRVIKEIAYE